MKKNRKEKNQRALQAERVNDYSAALGYIEIAAYTSLIFVVVLIFDTSLKAQFTLPKLLWLQTLLPAIALVWTIRAWRKFIKPMPPSILWTLLALTIWWIISTCFALHIPTALHGMTGRYNGLWTHLTWAAIFVFVATGGKARKRIELFIAIIATALLPAAIYAIYQYFNMDPSWPERRVPSTIGHPVLLAAVLGLALPFILAFMILARRAAWKIVCGIMFLLFASAMAATVSRGPWMGAAAGIVFMLALILARDRIRARHVIMVSLAALAILAAGIAFDGVRGFPLVKRAVQLTRPGAYSSFTNRFTFYAAAVEMVRDNPVVGVGFESFGVLYPRYRPMEGPAFGADVIPTMVHNGYLQAAATTGIPGLALYLSFIGAVLVSLVKTIRKSDQRGRVLGAALAGSIACSLVQDLTGWLEISLSLIFWIVLGLATSYIAAEKQTTQQQENPRKESRPVWLRLAPLFGALIVLSLIMLRSETMKELKADRLLTRAETGDVSRDWIPMQRDINSAIANSGGQAAYLDRAAVVYMDRAVKTGERAAYDRALMLFDQGQRQNRFNPYLLIHRLQLRVAALQHEATRTDSRDFNSDVAAAIRMDPNNPTVYETAARLRLEERNFREGLEFANRSVALRPDRGSYHTLAGDIHYALHNEAEAVAAYRRALECGEMDGNNWAATRNKIILIFINSNNIKAAIEEALIAVDRAPTDGMPHALLGLIYERQGRRELAEESFVTALKFDSDNAIAQEGLKRLAANYSTPSQGPGM
jgi:O-antigen ligase/tetratricopeptide (TPR) repeat protein